MNGYDILQQHLRTLNDAMTECLNEMHKQPGLTAEELIDNQKRYVDLQNTAHYVATYCNTVYPPKIVSPGNNGSGLKLAN